MDKVDRLYECYETLANAGDKIKEHEEEYKTILQAVKGETQEKMLASQFIPRFFKEFTHLTNEALDAQLDLIEDEDVAIRKQALKQLPSFCKIQRYLAKVADVLTQMMVCDDPSELSVVNNAMATVLKLNVKEALKGLFGQIKTTEEETVRKRAISFICNKIKFLPEDMVTKEIEEQILQEAKEAAKSLSAEDFSTLMALVANFRAAKTLQGQQSLIEMIMGQVELDKDFNHENAEETSSLLHCIRSALPFFNYYVSSSTFVKYICSQILPVIKNLASIDDEVDVSLEVLKLLAEISPYFNEKESDDLCLGKIYDTLIEYVPLPPAESLEDSALVVNEPNFQLTHIECLIYAFHQLAKKSPDFLTSEENAARFKELKLRLNFLARSVQGGSKRIKESLNDTKTKIATEEEQKLSIALRTMGNIHSLIKDLFHIPPSFKTVVVLSWKPSAGKRSDAQASLKRKSVSSDDGSDEKKKDWKSSRQLYTPPSGKYSGNVKFFSPRPGGGGGGGYFRGRGRGRFY